MDGPKESSLRPVWEWKGSVRQPWSCRPVKPSRFDSSQLQGACSTRGEWLKGTPKELRRSRRPTASGKKGGSAKGFWSQERPAPYSSWNGIGEQVLRGLPVLFVRRTHKGKQASYCQVCPTAFGPEETEVQDSEAAPDSLYQAVPRPKKEERNKAFPKGQARGSRLTRGGRRRSRPR